MGLLAFLQFSLKYFLDVLAWPLLALVFPLCASVRAIEINSFPETQKLNAYWVILSLIFFLEHALGRLLEWFPFWAYIKLMVVCCLVIPNFDGAFYVYKHLVWPCIFIKPRDLINGFNKRKESPVVSEKILAEMETYVRENGLEALEKLISPESNSSSSNVAEREIKAVKVIKKKEVASVKQKKGGKRPLAGSVADQVAELVEGTPATLEDDWVAKVAEDAKGIGSCDEAGKEGDVVSQTESDLIHSENINFAPVETTTSSEVQEWNCAICNVTTQSERNKISHLKAKKHKAAYQALKVNGVKSLLEIVPAPIPKKSRQPVKDPGNSDVVKQRRTASDQLKTEESKEEAEKSGSKRRRRRSGKKNKASVEQM
ncbi:hypothetical protein L484_014785 [Morus notabilis]|uniref:HVA22-like protein n=1 Tax=Morus notabilis TaxID=981085 RepID=W9SKJ4_9ROSA|nr:hypothetical protein L484_014785 [Morus notabilis]